MSRDRCATPASMHPFQPGRHPLAAPSMNVRGAGRRDTPDPLTRSAPSPGCCERRSSHARRRPGPRREGLRRPRSRGKFGCLRQQRTCLIPTSRRASLSSIGVFSARPSGAPCPLTFARSLRPRTSLGDAGALRHNRLRPAASRPAPARRLSPPVPVARAPRTTIREAHACARYDGPGRGHDPGDAATCELLGGMRANAVFHSHCRRRSR